MTARSLPTVRDELLPWAEAQGIAPLLALTAGALADHLPASVAEVVRGWGGALTAADLAAPDRWTRRTLEARLTPEDAERVQSAVADWLESAARRREEALAEEARLLAAPLPEDPLLAGLAERLLAWREGAREGLEPRPAEALPLPRIHLDREQAALVYAEGLGTEGIEVRLPLATWDDGVTPICGRCAGPCRHGLAAVDAWLVRLAGLGEAAPPLTALLGAPAWSRLFEALDGAQADAGLEPVPLRWTLTGDTPRFGLVPQGDPGADAGIAADRKAGAWLVPDATGQVPPARVFEALRALMAHPDVHLEGREGPVRIEAGRLSLAAVPRPGGAYALEPALEDRVTPLAQVLAWVEAAGAGGVFAQLDRSAGVLRLYELGEEARRVLHLLDRHGAVFPAESHEALLARVPALQGVLPVQLPQALRGEEMAADPTPVLRLIPVGDAALRVSARVRPVPGGPDFPAGQGPAEVHGRLGPGRVYAARPLVEERRRARAAADGLPGLDEAHADGPFSWRLAGEAALDLVARLSSLPPDQLAVEWPQGSAPWRIHPARPAGLRLGVRASRDWFGLSGGFELDGEQVELALLLEAVRRGSRYVQVRGGQWLAIAEDLRDRLAALAEQLDDRGGVGLGGAPALVDLLEEAADVDAGEAWSELEDRVRAARRLEAPVPAGLAATLRSYQVEGFRWMARLAAWGAGGVLADDMGLGKTVQTIALLLHRRESGPALVVAPTSVGPNWVREIGRFAPGLTVHLHAEAADRAATVSGLGPGDVLVVSYGLLARDLALLEPVSFGTLILDEAQAVKNPSATRSQAARAITAGFRLALSGTPVENHLGELWSLFSIVLPGLLGSHRRFRDRFVLPIEKDGAWSRRDALSRVVRPFVLRRTKREVLDELPPRVDVEVPVRLSAPERRLYEEARLAAVARISGLARDGVSPEQQRFEILSAITRLRLLACHPRLADTESEVPSSKLARAVELLVQLQAEGHRTLVFSQFTRHLQLLREALDARGFSYLYLDGGTPTLRRGQLVEAFQRGQGDAFLISLKAGGTGLTLTAADHVMHLDPWWNPALEDQATDRAHRMGQRRSVTVLRMVSEGTIEEAILDLHHHKRGLLAGILDGADSAGRLSLEEVGALLAESRLELGSEEGEEAEEGEPAGPAARPVFGREAMTRPPEVPARELRLKRRAGPKRAAARDARATGRSAAGPELELTPPPPPPAGRSADVPTCLGGSPAALEGAVRALTTRLVAEGSRGARAYPAALDRFVRWVDAASLHPELPFDEVVHQYLGALARGQVQAPPDEPVVARPALARLGRALAEGPAPKAR